MKPSEDWWIWRNIIYSRKNGRTRQQRINQANRFILLIRALQTRNIKSPNKLSMKSSRCFNMLASQRDSPDLRNPLKNVNNFTDINSYKRNEKEYKKKYIVPMHSKPHPIDSSKCPNFKKARNQFHLKFPSAREIQKVFKYCNKNLIQDLMVFHIPNWWILIRTSWCLKNSSNRFQI